MARWLAMGLATVVIGACVGRPPEDATGEEIYLQVCANCHGSDLEGRVGPALGPGSDSVERPDEFLVVTITEGRGRMPSFATTLSDDQVRRLVEYLRSVQAG